jgi:taurine dioxygenase
MKFENIHPTWGSTLTFENPLEFFDQDINYWRSKLYERKALVFKRMNFSKEDYVEFCKRFGRLWDSKQAYIERKEKVIEADGYPLSAFSNLYHPRLGNGGMKWHADLPNEYKNPFPIRSIWITQNPNPAAGKTGFLNVAEFDSLPPQFKNKIDRIEIVQQRWHRHEDASFTPFRDLQRFPFLKTHPITGEKSLRLNSYNIPGVSNDEWICKVFVDGIEQEDCFLLRDYIDQLLTNPNLVYWHTWDDFDILIYDNWSFVHCRTNLQLEPGQERMLYRANIDHVPDNYWPLGD